MTITILSSRLKYKLARKRSYSESHCISRKLLFDYMQNSRITKIDKRINLYFYNKFILYAYTVAKNMANRLDEDRVRYTKWLKI